MLRRALRTLLPLDGALPGGRALQPDIAVLVPTLRCNLRCPYCFQRDETGLAWQPPDQGELSLGEWLAVVADLAPLGPHVIVIGGELFLYRDALKLLRAVKAAGLPLTIITNGTGLPRAAAELLEIGLDRLIVSLDGPPEIHNAVRGHPRAYQLAAEGIARVLASRRSNWQPFVQVSCAISAYTQAHLAAFVAEAGRLGVDQIVLNGLIYASAEQAEAQRVALHTAFGVEHCRAKVLDNGAQHGVALALLRDELAAIRASPWSERVIVAPPGVEQHLDAYFALGAPPFHGQRCTAIHRELWVMPNGDISACGYINELSMGNARAGGVLAAWNSPLYRRFRQRLSAGLLPTCTRCSKLSFERPPPLLSLGAEVEG
jgi:radical SAM protein with 4Fe4S-binding SPASM domain